MKKPDPKARKPRTSTWPDAEWLQSWPRLVEHIADQTWEDGSPRETSTLVLKGQDDMVLAALNDREAKCSLYRVGSTVQEALDAIEKALDDQTGDWRPWNKGSGQGGGGLKRP